MTSWTVEQPKLTLTDLLDEYCSGCKCHDKACTCIEQFVDYLSDKVEVLPTIKVK